MAAELRVGRPLRRRLARVDRATRDADVRIRCRILLKVIAGEGCRAAARALGCAPSTASRIVARFKAYGEAAVRDGRRENGIRKVDADVEAGIGVILMHTADAYGFTRPTWTLELLAQVVAEKLDVKLSRGHLWKILRRMRVRWGRPRPIVACPWKAAQRVARIAALRRLAARRLPGEVVVFVDEVDVHLNPKIGPDWMLPSTQRTILTPGKNEKRYLAGAYDHENQRLVYVEGDRKASWLFLNLLRALLASYPGMRAIHVILDNYGIHKSRLVQSWMMAFGSKIRLEFLPPYCPQENRIERLWLDLHANVTRNHRCRTMAALMGAVHHYLSSRFDLVQVQARAA